MSNSVDSLIVGLGGSVSPEVASVLSPPSEIFPFDRQTPPPFGGAVEAPLTRKDEQAIVSDARAPAAARGTSMAGATKRFGVLSRLVPGGNRVRIKKRLDNGQIATIEDYVIRDIEQDGDVETFITRRLKPVHGGGEYSVYIIDDKSVDHFAGTVNLMPEPKGVAVGDNALIGLLARAQDDLKNALRQPQPDALEQFDRTRMIMERMDGGNGGGKNDMLIAMMNMQQQATAAAAQSQREMMTALLSSRTPSVDPGLASLMERMDRRLEKLEQAPPPMSAPPMVPTGPSITEILTAITGFAGAVVVPLMQSMRSEPMKPETLIGLITGAQAVAAQAAGADKVTTRELLEIVRGEKERERPAVTLDDEIGRAMKMREFASSFAPQASGPAGTSFWDALVALFSSNDFAAAIGGTIRERTKPVLVPQLQPQNPQQAQVVDLAQERASRAAAKDVITLPEGFEVLCQALDTAEDDAGRVEAALRALFALHSLDQWKPFVNTLLEHAARDEKETLLRGMGGWFKMLVEKGGLLKRESAIATLKSFDEHWALIRADLLNRMPHLKALAPQVQAVPETVPEAPAAPAAPEAPATVAPPVDVPAGLVEGLYAAQPY